MIAAWAWVKARSLAIAAFLGIGFVILLAWIKNARDTAALKADLAKARAGESEAQRRVLIREAEALEDAATEAQADASRAAATVEAAKERIEVMDAHDVARQFNRIRRVK